nr:hypothetical protein L203_04628 [Cryptococcus depauperatus CBS 7841]
MMTSVAGANSVLGFPISNHKEDQKKIISSASCIYSSSIPQWITSQIVNRMIMVSLSMRSVAQITLLYILMKLKEQCDLNTPSTSTCVLVQPLNQAQLVLAFVYSVSKALESLSKGLDRN